MKIVIDCNVLVSATRTDGVCRSVVDAAVRSHGIVLSGPVVAEYKAVAARSKHTAYRHALRSAIEDMERIAVFVEPANVVFGLGDPDDEVYLTTAAAGGAALVTGNTRDFTEPRYGPVEVYSPRRFLERAM